MLQLAHVATIKTLSQSSSTILKEKFNVLNMFKKLEFVAPVFGPSLTLSPLT